MTKYAKRDAQSKIVGFVSWPTAGFPEQIEDDHSDLVAFIDSVAHPPPGDPVETPLTGEDAERLFLSQGITRGQINVAKRDRGKPLP